MGLTVPLSVFLKAQEVDLLATISWQLCGDKNATRPDRISESLLIADKADKPTTFDSPDDFEAFRASIFNPRGGE